MATPAVRIDVRGLACSDAVVRLHKTLAQLAEGSLVLALSDDIEVVEDLKRYAARAGHAWNGARELAGGLVEAEVRRGA